MLYVILGIAATFFSTALGVGIGWLLHRHFTAAQLEMELAAAKNDRDKTSRQDAEKIRSAELMAKLTEVTTGVASEVGKHSGNIEAINAELVAVKEGDAGAVVLAVQKILHANEQMQQELQHAEARLQDQQRELIAQTEAARTDQLTKITNRRALDEELKKCVLEFQRSLRPFCVMVLDVDYFKEFNDTHGHLAGDEVLKSVAQNMKAQLLESELIARYGGEEFVVIFRGDSLAVCRDRAELLRASINACGITFEGKELRVAASAGVAEIGIGEDERGLVRRADEALYFSKRSGRNCAHWNDGQQNLPITPELLAKLAAVQGKPAAKAGETGNRRFELYDIRFSDSSFSPNLDRRVAEWKRTGHPFSMALCAIDHLEQIRNSQGEEILQRVVSAAGSVIGCCIRDMDQVAGYGEGSFAIFLPTAEGQFALQVAERVRTSVEKLYAPAGILPPFTVSVAVAEVIEGNDSSRLFQRAQIALEAAQGEGGNGTYLHDGLEAVQMSEAAQQPVTA